MSKRAPIVLKQVKVHNLKSVDLTIEANQLVVLTGVSGSGKSSLAFDTIYVEGQRRYIESLSTYARRHLGDLTKPDAKSITGISPPVAIEQKTTSQNPRSTVGTLTGIYDYLRVLFAKAAVAYCPISKERVSSMSQEEIISKVQSFPEGSKIIILAPILKGKKSSLKDETEELLRKGFMRARIDSEIVDLSQEVQVNKNTSHDLDVVIDRIKVDSSNKSRIAEAVILGLEIGDGILSILDTKDDTETLFSKHAYSKKSKTAYPPLRPEDFSFNHPSGMCDACEGLGVSMEFDLDLIFDPDKSISEDCCTIAGSYQTVRWKNIFDNVANLYDFSVKTPWKKLSKRAQDQFLYGNKKKWTRMKFIHPETGKTWDDVVKWRGVIGEAKRRISEAKSELYRKNMEKLMTKAVCSSCSGSRLKPYPSVAKFKDKTIFELTSSPISELLKFFNSIELTDNEKLIAKDLLSEIKDRLTFLEKVGLHYLSLERTAPTLSGGESQRVRLAYHLGSGLVGTTYILDEPSIGLHPTDNEKLIKTLQSLKSRGNTVLVVEHDEETILSADVVIDVGPLAGSKGGEILFQGSPDKLLKDKKSLTGAYLSGSKSIEMPKKLRSLDKGSLTVYKAEHHNLKNIDVSFPLKTFISITGLSGTGKSSLILETLYPALANTLHKAEHYVGKHSSIEGMGQIDKVIAIDQTPIGRTPRSNPATYIKLFDDIRDLFSELKESKIQGFKPGRFSFNVLEGSCPHCRGMGYIKVDMDFMEDVWDLCSVCEGKRFDTKTLSVRYKGKSIFDILDMTIENALLFFENIPKISKKLELLYEVGLGYIKLGQSSTTLSGGEAQRIKLAKELVRPSTGQTLYILDEPTTGLHFEDISKLLEILHRLVNVGNTVIVIEHNMEVVKTSDYVIDLGKEGGAKGGQINFKGRVNDLIKTKLPTAISLKKTIEKSWDGFSTKSGSLSSGVEPITVQGASQNHLKSVNVSIPHGQITVCTGPSGSGKSSLAFETIYAEGQRRYVETLSSYARQFVKQMPKATVKEIQGLCPAIAIEQKHHAGNPRSTIGTMTEIYDYLRVIYAQAGQAFCPETKEPIKKISKEFVISKLLDNYLNSKLIVLSPLDIKKQDFIALIDKYQKHGFLRIRLNDTYYEMDNEIPFDSKKENKLFLVIDRLIIKPENEKRLYEAIEVAAEVSSNLFTLSIDGKDLLYNLSFAVESTGKSYNPITPQTFSYNADAGMCRQCLGLGMQLGANFEHDEALVELSLSEIFLELLKGNSTRSTFKTLLSLCKKEKIDPDLPIAELSKAKRNVALNGSETIHDISGIKLRYLGLHNILETAGKCGRNFMKKSLEPLLEETLCSACHGSRLNPLASLVELDKFTLPKLCSVPIEKAYQFMKKVSLTIEQKKLLSEPLSQLLSRFEFLCQIGLDYLSLDRSAPTLSGGETQRIYLARQLGSGLTGTLYVLDEPTIGLHPHNNHLLNQSLSKLKDLGNTLLVVEHDPMTMAIADKIIDMGPKAGKLGGKIIAEGTLEEIRKNPKSLTGQYLNNKTLLKPPSKPREAYAYLHLKNATLHNLKNISVKFGAGTITSVTGVSGSGKSSLVMGTLAPLLKQAFQKRTVFDGVTSTFGSLSGCQAFNKVLTMTQNPIGQTSRADVSTYVELFTHLRSFFAELPLARSKGLKPANFSFNHRKGMCKTCYGLGYKIVELQFIPSVRIPCESCRGLRLNPVSLEVHYKDKNLGEILKLSVKDALDFMPDIPKVQKTIQALNDVGLSYLELGQDVQTLSGGESQRLKLAKELAKRSRKKTLFLFDEPTIGLHFEDIHNLLSVFHQLANQGHTIIIIEHNLDIIAHSDLVIDLGPGGGELGGDLIAMSSPQKLKGNSNSLTGTYLKKH